MSLRVHYFLLNHNCIHCNEEDAPICRTTIVDGELKGIAVTCKSCGRQERAFASKKPSKTNLMAVAKHCEAMKASKAKSVKSEQQRCMRSVRAEAKARGWKL